MKKYNSATIQHCFLVILLALSISSARAQWVKTDIPLSAQATSFTLSETSFFAGTNQGVFRSTDNGSSWQAINTGLTPILVHALAVNGTTLIAGLSDQLGDGAVSVSTNNGANWATTTGISTAVMCLAVKGTNIFAGTSTGSGVFLSTNNGKNWKNVNVDMQGPNLQALSVNGSNIFAGTDQGIFLSTNNGINWKTINTGLTDRYIYAMAAEKTNILAGSTFDGVFLSTNNGTNWSPINNGLQGYQSISIAALAVSETNFFVGTDSGVFLSTDNGANWTAVNSGLTNDTVNAIGVVGTNLFAGTNGGTWMRPLSEMISTGSVSPNERPATFTMQQNYPNPFKLHTLINYTTSVHEPVRITLSNLLGEQLQILLSEDVDAGVHDLTINGNDLTSGVYVVTMSAGGVSKSQNICVQK
jgi:photosystem II stability/assembly factor-like uncharacterized protein